MKVPSPSIRVIALAAGTASSLLLLTGCSVAGDAVVQGRQALEQGQSALASASALGANAEQLIQATAQLAGACVAAQAAWLPGVSASDAYAALDEAAATVNEVIALQVEVPGARAISEALGAARGALDEGQTEFGISQRTLTTACALVRAGG